MPRTLEPGDVPAALRGGQLPGLRTPSLPRGRRSGVPGPMDSSEGCVGCRRNYSPGANRTSETSFNDSCPRTVPTAPRTVPTALFQGSAPRTSRVLSSVDEPRTYTDDSELCTRTSWVDAETAYKQVKRGKATGNKSALWLRWRLQKQLFSLGCFTQKHCGKVLFLGLLLLSLCCVGLKTATIETNVERLWVEEGGRLEQELEYTKQVLGEGSGSTHEIVIQTPAHGSNLLSVDSFMLHQRALRAATEISVELHDRTWDFTDLCFKPSFPSIDEGGFIDSILERLQPCTIVTPLDCFWEASKLLGPKHAVYLPGYQGQAFYWTNLDPNKLAESISALKYALPVSGDSIREILKRAGITTAYQEKPCLNPHDEQCPQTAPNYESKQAPDIGAEITGGCAGFAKRYMHWEEELIVGGASKDKHRRIVKAEAIQSMVLLLGERELFEYYRRDIIDWSLEQAKEVLQAWQRKFTEEINKVVTETADNRTRDHVYPFSSASMLDLLEDFSQMSPVRVGLGYAFMLVYACVSMSRWTDPVQSQSGVGMAGVILVSLSVAAGLGLCSVLGIKFNASTTQIIPFLALGLGVDDMFLIGQTVSENTRKTDIPYMEQTGECLKRVGVSVLITSLSNACAFFMAAIIPIPALRAFCLQAAVLVLFNLATILLVFPAVISLDMLRREGQKVDVLCCITGSSSRALVVDPRVKKANCTIRGRTPPPDYFDTRPPGYCNPSMHHIITQTTADGTHPVTVLAPPPKYETHGFHSAPVAPPPVPPSTTSSQQCLTPEEPTTGWYQHCRTNPRELCNWPLMRLARNFIAPLLQKTPVKILVVVMSLVGIVLGIVGTVQVEDGLDITDIVPRDTLEYKFLKAQSQYFGFYNFHAITKEEMDYPSQQKLLHDYHKAFQRVDKIIKKEDGSLPDFWLALMRDWLLDMQRAFDKDRRAGSIVRDGWYINASDDGVLGYMLMVQTGHRDRPIDKNRVVSGRLVDEAGIMYTPAFYNFLTAWTTVDALAYYASEANLHPPTRAWTYSRDHYGNNFLNATPDSTQIPKSQPLIFSQMAFYLHDLGDTVAITATVQEIRAICDRFSELGLPTYPSGIVFTFWEQYLGLRFHLMLALICVLGGIFMVLLLVLLSPWTAVVVVTVLAMMVVELFGFMGLIGIKLSAVPAVILIVSVGIGVEFTVHICLGFVTAIGSRNKRMRMALEHMFGPVVHGAMTTFLGVVMLALSEFDFIVKYFFVVLTALIVIGLLNGLVLLPVLLSVLGPRGEVVPKDQSDYLAPPTPEPTPPPARRERTVRSVSRRVFPRMPSDISLTTITEEQSSQYSSQDSQIAVTVQPEVVVETTIDGHHGNHSSSSSLNSSVPGSDESTPPTSSRHVTTVKATTRVKVQVHRPRQGDGSEYKSKRRKYPQKDPEIVEIDMESDEDCSSS